MSDADDPLSANPRPLVGGQKRLDILDAAIGVIVDRGFDATRYQDIAEASGVAVSTLQYYFGSLESLLIESCLHASERDYQKARDLLLERTDPWDRLTFLVGSFVTSGTPGMNWQAQIEYWRAAFTRPHLRESLIRDQDRWRAFFSETIEAGIEAGVFTTDRDPALIAMQLNCLADGTVFPAFARNPAFDADAFLAAAIDDLAALLGVSIDGG
ncbi:MAG TPA: TetR/AcrR family transcriptional regulator [Thermomicrobiales bacterium]|nr:TetR/AcrR family transcriptional regulator [Thermomicrobiales bacterium]